ncbi:cytochrome b [Pseudomonas abietaniphila]|jgi:cytochrome b561|uniref:Cytochrome b561 n=1 Tax=Pseudomonas abietaniphila TaxID=89065 RepID=A0A1G7WWY1_9PSED|nr:cytochrome b/b6 domain-containing protein [Pseudomonas abietaniphila]SDG76432.1 cytochrome b561 [Pseudomonas abietaniphila]
MHLPGSYSRVQIGLHWLSAVVILWALVTGSLLSFLELPAEIKDGMASFNVSLTTVFIPFFMLRLYVAASRSAASINASWTLQQVAARLTHRAIYTLTTVVLISGVLMMQHGADVFGFAQFGPVLTHVWLREWFTQIHTWSCVALAALITLHVAAVIKHQLSGHSIIKRMWH